MFNPLFLGNVKSIYLASPFFNEAESAVYKKVIKYLRDAGYEVYVPQEHTVDNAWDLPNPVWGNRVFLEDVRAIRECDAVVVLNWGLYSDSGTAWEQGFAYGLEKPIVSIIVNQENDCEKFSLMMVNGCTTSILLSDILEGPANFTDYKQK